MKDKRYLEWGISLWIGIGLMSIINVWKITQNQHAISYSWIMFGISIIAIIICLILIKTSNIKSLLRIERGVQLFTTINLLQHVLVRDFQ